MCFDRCRQMARRLRDGGGEKLVMGLVTLFLAACAGDAPVNLGIKSGALAPCPNSPNCVSSYAADEKQRIAPLAFADEADAAFARLKQLLTRRDDTSITEEREGYLRVELRTTLFVDDAEFLLDREHRAIHLRSASRRGYSDLGKNRQRIEEIRAQFQTTSPTQ